jgi:drug/metabolite transporter (DMT)-like permease
VPRSRRRTRLDHTFLGERWPAEPTPALRDTTIGRAVQARSAISRSPSEAEKTKMTITRSATELAAMAATLSSVANGAQLVATRFLVQHHDPLTVALLRYAIAFACLAPLLRSARLPSLRDCVIILSLGAIVAGICPWLLTLGMRYTTASRGALVICTSPLLTLMMAAVLGYERCTVRRLAGAACAVLGVAIGLSGQLSAGTALSMINVGDAIVLLTTLLLALFNVYAGAVLTRYRATTMVPIATIGGLVVLFGFASFDGALQAISFFNAADWAALFFCGTVGGAGVLFLWSWAIEYASAGRIAVFVSAAPMSAAIIGAIAFSEPVTVELVAGTVLIVAGIFLVYRTGPAAGDEDRTSQALVSKASQSTQGVVPPSHA